jgi:hypothetical protein
MTEDNGLMFSDVDTATRFRDWLARQITSAVDRLRPLPRYGRVMSYNRFTGKCMVLFTGDVEATPCRMSNQTQPYQSSDNNVSGDPNAGDIARVEGRPGSYYVTEIVSGVALQLQPVLFHPRFQTGGFMHIPSMIWDSFSAGLPAVGSTWHIGRWDNASSFGSDATGLLEIQIQWTFFTNNIRKYIIPIIFSHTSGGWVKVAPLYDSGQNNGNEYDLEIMVDSTGFELRLRRIKQGGGFTPGGWDVRLEISLDNVSRINGSELNEEVTAEPTRYLGTQTPGEMKGPYLSPAVWAPTLAQAAMTGGGRISWDGNTLGWSQAFRIGAVGQSSQAKWGYFEAAQPANGTGINIYGNPGSTFLFATPDGVPLSGNQALYYEPPWGDTFTSVAGNYRIVDEGLGTYTHFNVPSHWILIAQRSDQSGTPSLKLGTGEQIDHWRTPTLLNSWQNFGGTHAAAGYKMLDGRQVKMKGLVKNTVAASAGLPMFNLPVEYRPSEIQVFTGSDSATGTQTRVDVENDGDVLSPGHASVAVGFISLAQVHYYLS